MGHVDWDASRRERRAKQTPNTMQVFGETITLPPGVPAGLALDLMELETQAGSDADLEELIDLGQLLEMLHQIFTEERVAAWRSRSDMTIDELFDLLFTAMKMIGAPLAGKDGGSGEAPSGPGSGPASSSTDGRRSKPTSKPSTGSTSRTRTRSRA